MEHEHGTQPCPNCEQQAAAMQELALQERRIANVQTRAVTVTVDELNDGAAATVAIEVPSGWVLARESRPGQFDFRSYEESFRWLNVSISGRDDCEHGTIFTESVPDTELCGICGSSERVCATTRDTPNGLICIACVADLT